MKGLILSTSVVVALLVPGCATGATPTDTKGGGSAPALAAPALNVEVMAEGYSKVWDVAAITETKWLFTERAGKLHLYQNGNIEAVDFPSATVATGGEAGLMSLALAPNFASSKRFYTCQAGFKDNGNKDVRIMAWTLDESTNPASAKSAGVVLKGMPFSSGRHSGCRMLIDRRNGSMWVGTGDAAIGTVPRNLKSLGGKVLRLDPATGKPWSTNPWITATSVKQRYVSSYGHRNIQGVAQRANGTIWTAEHGPEISDEVNRNVNGGDYGWHPVPGYNESVPMTDDNLPGTQIAAKWTSGPTPAPSGISFVTGSQWGDLEGTLAMACLDGEHVKFLKFTASGQLTSIAVPNELENIGRMRSVTQLPSGKLLITTDLTGGPSILMVSPK